MVIAVVLAMTTVVIIAYLAVRSVNRKGRYDYKPLYGIEDEMSVKLLDRIRSTDVYMDNPAVIEPLQESSLVDRDNRRVGTTNMTQKQMSLAREGRRERRMSV